jgi:hypothetical protein
MAWKMKIVESVIPEALIDRSDMVENGPANPVPVLKSPINPLGKLLRNPRMVHSPMLYETPMKILQNIANN